MSVVAQPGEFEVFRSILKYSLPVIAGWAPLVDIAVTSAMNDVARDAVGYESGYGGGGSGQSGGGGGGYRSGGDFPLPF
jgi:uncharacterized membrane protein YgcG